MKKKKIKNEKQAARKPLIVTNKERNLDGGLQNRTVEQEFLMKEVNLVKEVVDELSKSVSYDSSQGFIDSDSL